MSIDDTETTNGEKPLPFGMRACDECGQVVRVETMWRTTDGVILCDDCHHMMAED